MPFRFCARTVLLEGVAAGPNNHIRKTRYSGVYVENTRLSFFNFYVGWLESHDRHIRNQAQKGT